MEVIGQLHVPAALHQG